MFQNMNGPSSGTKKPTICRYFSSNGACYFGNECQFIHANPSSTIQNNDMIIRDFPSHIRSTDATTSPGIDPLFQAFTSTTTLPPESKLQTYLNPPSSAGISAAVPNNTSSSVLPENSKYFVSPNSDALTTAIGSLTLDSTRKTPNSFVSTRLTHSMSSPSFSQQYGGGPSATAAVATSPFNHFSSPGELPPAPPPPPPPSRLCGVPLSGISPEQSPMITRKSPLVVPPTFQNTSPPAPEFVTTLFQQESVEGTTYFYPTTTTTAADESAAQLSEEQPPSILLPDFDVFPGNPAHMEHMKPKANAPSFFLPDELRMEILHRHSLAMAQVNPEQHPDLPAEVDVYHNLCPLETSPPTKSSLSGFVTSVYKATNIKTGIHYCLRRIHGFRVTNPKCMTLLEVWKKMQHSNLVHLRESFTTKAFGDHSLVFVYDYHPGADTLMNLYFNHSQGMNSAPSNMNGFISNIYSTGSGTAAATEPLSSPFAQNKAQWKEGYIWSNVTEQRGLTNLRQHAGLLPESLIWAYIVQLSSVLRTIHAAGLACRTIEPSKILITAKSRLRLNCCGIFDVLNYDVNQSNPKAVVLHYQQEDLIMFGKVVLALACNSLAAIQRSNHSLSMELITRNYSADLKNLIIHLCANHRTRSINDIMPMIGARFYTQLDAAHLRSDVIELELAKEVQNGRMFRMLCKLGAINERQEFNMDPAWSETGDRYPLKLFRDYLFHQVTEDGRPWLDLAHLVHTLNKLDAGSPEKICLISRDEQNVLIVSYAELKQCFESAFSELLTGSTTKPS